MATEEKRARVDALLNGLRQQLEEADDVRCDVVRGVTRMDNGTGYWEHAPNGTLTIVIRINGGQRDMERPYSAFRSQIEGPSDADG